MFLLLMPLEIRIVVDARYNPPRLKAAPDGVPQTQVETPHIDDLLSALTTVYGDHLIAARDECQTWGSSKCVDVMWRSRFSRRFLPSKR